MHPVLSLEGSPYQQGFSHGRLARELIHDNIEVYFHRFASEGGLDRGTALARAEVLWRRLEATHPDYAAMVRGLAEGAQAGLAEIAALNVRYEILYSAFTERAMADGCTAFAALPEVTADGHTLIGQNWDWIPEARGVVLHVVEPDGHARLCFTEAGIVGGKIGLNDAGLGLVINGVTSTDDQWERDATPFHVRCWEILGERTLESALDRIEHGSRPCAANFLVAQPGHGAADVEAAPHGTFRGPVRDGLLVHANHLLHAEELGAQEPPNPRRHLSIHRYDRLDELLASGRGQITAGSLRAHLRDHEGHPNSVCRHPDETEGIFPYETVTSVIMDLDQRTMWVSDGPPCANDYRVLRLHGATHEDGGRIVDAAD